MIDRNILKGVEAVGHNFTQPNDDWQPVLFLYSPERGLQIIAIVNFDTAAKQAFPAMLRALFYEHKPTSAAFVVSIWYVLADLPGAKTAQEAMDLLDGIQPSKHPDRKEAVQVTLCDGNIEETWRADIVRHASLPPSLKDWELMDQDSEQGGQLANLLISAFEDTRE
jgi:hypothetical protein